MLKADVIISEHVIRDASVKTALNPVRNLDEVITGYSAEVTFGPAIIELNRIGQLYDLIDTLTDLREIWISRSVS